MRLFAIAIVVLLGVSAYAGRLQYNATDRMGRPSEESVGMREWVLLMFLAGFTPPAVSENAVPLVKVTVDQLEQAVTASHGKADADVAEQLMNMELIERLNTAKLQHLEADLPGSKAQEALMALADRSAFLNPPDAEVAATPPPDPAALRKMMALIVNYVNTTARQLPNLIATRSTTGFEDRPQEDVQEATGLMTLIYLPLHVVAKSSVEVTYRDRQEVVDAKAVKAQKHGPQISGLVTSGQWRMRSRAKLHGAIGNRVQGEPRLCSTTRFPMKSHTTKCSSAASRTDSIPMGRPTFRSLVSVPAITARLHSIQRQERFFASRWRPKCSRANWFPRPPCSSNTVR